MAQVIWSQPAIDSLDEIANYIALDEMRAAQKMVNKIINAVNKLHEFPQSGRVIPELNEGNYRELIVGPCRIFYRAEEHSVYVLYVMRSERQLRQFMLDGQVHEEQSEYKAG
jgi:toxin ParE1/3/4